MGRYDHDWGYGSGTNRAIERQIARNNARVFNGYTTYVLNNGPCYGDRYRARAAMAELLRENTFNRHCWERSYNRFANYDGYDSGRRMGWIEASRARRYGDDYGYRYGGYRDNQTARTVAGVAAAATLLAAFTGVMRNMQG